MPPITGKGDAGVSALVSKRSSFLLGVTATIFGFGLLVHFQPTKQTFDSQITGPYILGLRAHLREETSGLRTLGRALFPGIAEAGRELSTPYWEEITQKINTNTTAEHFLFMTQYKTVWAWGIGREGCETRAFGMAGKIWIIEPDTCGIELYRSKGGGI